MRKRKKGEERGKGKGWCNNLIINEVDLKS